MELTVIALVALAAFAAVVWPLVRGRDEPWEPAGATEAGPVESALRAEIDRYREALRAGTVCGRCATANRAGSRFCAACGFRLEADPAAAPDA